KVEFGHKVSPYRRILLHRHIRRTPSALACLPEGFVRFICLIGNYFSPRPSLSDPCQDDFAVFFYSPNEFAVLRLSSLILQVNVQHNDLAVPFRLIQQARVQGAIPPRPHLLQELVRLLVNLNHKDLVCLGLWPEETRDIETQMVQPLTGWK